MSEARTCEACRWWKPCQMTEEGKPTLGDCRRNPPIVVSDVMSENNRDFGFGVYTEVYEKWPLTSAVDWCGEFQGKGPLSQGPLSHMRLVMGKPPIASAPMDFDEPIHTEEPK